MVLSSSNTIKSDADYRRRERRARYAARKQGYVLIKSRTRIEAATDFGQFYIGQDGWIVAGQYGGLDLDEVEAFLNQ
jgi:hypothetical protein